jgi:hypothetical protein
MATKSAINLNDRATPENLGAIFDEINLSPGPARDATGVQCLKLMGVMKYNGREISAVATCYCDGYADCLKEK